MGFWMAIAVVSWILALAGLFVLSVSAFMPSYGNARPVHGVIFAVAAVALFAAPFGLW